MAGKHPVVVHDTEIIGGINKALVVAADGATPTLDWVILRISRRTNSTFESISWHTPKQCRASTRYYKSHRQAKPPLEPHGHDEHEECHA